MPRGGSDVTAQLLGMLRRFPVVQCERIALVLDDNARADAGGVRNLRRKSGGNGFAQ